MNSMQWETWGVVEFWIYMFSIDSFAVCLGGQIGLFVSLRIIPALLPWRGGNGQFSEGLKKDYNYLLSLLFK